MSESLSPPWIADYLINLAETYGCNISNIPVHLKPGKKIQLLQASPIMRAGNVGLISIALVPHFPPIHPG
jgi:hypothetical protein